MPGLARTFLAGLPTVKDYTPAPIRYVRGGGAVGAPNSRRWPLGDHLADLDESRNSIVWACMTQKANGFSTAPITLQRTIKLGATTTDEKVTDHPLVQLLKRPADTQSALQLFNVVVSHIELKGNAVLRKARNDVGIVKQLWPLRPEMCTMVQPSELPERLWDFYKVEKSDPIAVWSVMTRTGPQLYPTTDIVHLIDKPDPEDYRKGRSHLQAALSEVFTDNEAAAYTSALLFNSGIPGVVLSFNQDDKQPLTQAEAVDLAKSFADTFTGEGRGRAWVPWGHGKPNINQLSFNPEEMNLKGLRRLTEERICSVMGVPAVVAQVGAGNDMSHYANYATARTAFFEGTIVPYWNTIQEQLYRQLAPDFGLGDDHSLMFDTTKAKPLQKETRDEVDTIDKAIQGGWAMVAEGRERLQLPVEDHHRIFLRSANKLEINADGEAVDYIAADAAAPAPEPDDDDDDVTAAQPAAEASINGVPVSELETRVKAGTALIRAGYNPSSAMAFVGFTTGSLEHTGRFPVTTKSPDPDEVPPE